MKPVMYYFANKYFVFTDETKHKEMQVLMPKNNTQQPYVVCVDEVPEIRGWKLYITGQRGDGSPLVDPKNSVNGIDPNFDTLEDAMAYVEDSYKAFLGDAGLAELFEKKALYKTKGYATFNGSLTPVWK